jgi:predicted nucleic acid-binding protein
MKALFDTSVLVPVFYGDHVYHRTSLALFIQFDRSSGCCGAHSLAEVFSTLTRMPGRHRPAATAHIEPEVTFGLVPLCRKESSSHLHLTRKSFIVLEKTISAGDGSSRNRALAGSCLKSRPSA